jgi:hypothetical protein
MKIFLVLRGPNYQLEISWNLLETARNPCRNNLETGQNSCELKWYTESLCHLVFLFGSTRELALNCGTSCRTMVEKNSTWWRWYMVNSQAFHQCLVCSRSLNQ